MPSLARSLHVGKKRIQMQGKAILQSTQNTAIYCDIINPSLRAVPAALGAESGKMAARVLPLVVLLGLSLGASAWTWTDLFAGLYQPASNDWDPPGWYHGKDGPIFEASEATPGLGLTGHWVVPHVHADREHTSHATLVLCRLRSMALAPCTLQVLQTSDNVELRRYKPSGLIRMCHAACGITSQ
jgi:hypothetical protein